MSDVFWYHDARQLDAVDSDGRCSVTQINDGDESTVRSRLRVRKVERRDAGTYDVVAVDDVDTCKHVFSVTVHSTYIYPYSENSVHIFTAFHHHHLFLSSKQTGSENKVT